MPQLRDSGNHSTAPLDAHTKFTLARKTEREKGLVI